eukprot:5263107-Prymnesium_polylepis.2
MPISHLLAGKYQLRKAAQSSFPSHRTCRTCMAAERQWRRTNNGDHPDMDRSTADRPGSNVWRQLRRHPWNTDMGTRYVGTLRSALRARTGRAALHSCSRRTAAALPRSRGRTDRILGCRRDTA